VSKLSLGLVLSCALLTGAAVPAQEPPRDGDRAFFQAQVMRAIDEKATLLIEQGKPDAAVAELQRASAIDVPKDHPAFDMRARLLGRRAITLTALGRGKEGVEAIQTLIAEVPPGSPAEAAAWLDAGVVYRQAGMPDEALKAFDKAIELSQRLAEGGRRLPPQPPGSRRPRPQPNGGPL
jgi:tetratricopeptide (TPR) repeat protein